MKAKLLLSIMLLSGAAAMAQTSTPDTDVTPPRFKFSDQPIGRYEYTLVSDKPETSNPPALLAEAKSDLGGDIFLFGWEQYVSVGGVDDKWVTYMREATNILDMGGEVGKVLCIKGHACTNEIFPYGVKPASWPGGDFGWPSMGLYFGSKINGVDYDAKTKYTGRFKIVYRVVLPSEEYSDQVASMTYTMKEYGGTVLSGIDQVKAFSADTEDEDTWCLLENDFTFMGNDEVVPLYLKLGLDRVRTQSGVLLIKEMKLTINPTGEALGFDTFTLASDPPTGITENEVAALNYRIEGNTLFVDNLKEGEIVSLYNNVGMLMGQKTVSSQSATFSIAEKGVFYLQAGSKKAVVIK